MLERNVENYLVEQVKATGGEIRKVKWIGRRGAPDRYVMLPAFPKTCWDTPVTCWVETKRPKKGAEKHQAREHQRLRDFGELVFVLDTTDKVDDFIAGRFRLP